MELTEDQKNNAITNAIPRPPRKHELGGGIYYTCYWESCNNTIKRWQNYCDQCGQKIEWEDEK